MNNSSKWASSPNQDGFEDFFELFDWKSTEELEKVSETESFSDLFQKALNEYDKIDRNEHQKIGANYTAIEDIIQKNDEESEEYLLDYGSGMLYIDKTQSQCSSSSYCSQSLSSDEISDTKFCKEIPRKIGHQAPSSSYGRKNDAAMKEYALSCDRKTYLVCKRIKIICLTVYFILILHAIF